MFLNGIILLILLFTACSGDKIKPNVIIVITDDQGYGDIAALGNPWIKTPNMDKLWEESVRLTDYHVSPTCAPTRAALMTGRYNDRVGVWHTVTGRTLLRENEITMAKVFEDNGYATGMFGKWHLGDNYPRRPMDVGFQKAIYIGGAAIGNAGDYWDNDYFDDYYYDNGKYRQFEGYCTDVWFREATKFIDSNKDKPFFCYLATNAPHGPYYVEDKYSNQYKTDTLIPNANFYGMITNIDENLGKLRAYLKEENLEDNTIFIFMTDNGSASGIKLDASGQRIPNDGIPTVYGFDAGMRGMKGSPFDGGHRVPCFIYWPAGGVNEGRDFDGLTAHIDILPSLVEMCRLVRNEGQEFDGISLWKYLTGKLKWRKGERTLFVDSQRIEEPVYSRRSAVMQEEWRLLYNDELFNMRFDPGQRLDVAPRYPEKAKELKSLYDNWYNDVFSAYAIRSYIHIGSVKAPTVKLSSHDWMGVVATDEKEAVPPGEQIVPPHSHARIRSGVLINGYWDIEVEKSGEYLIELLRWPKEAGKGIREGIPASTIPIPGGRPFPKGVALDIKKARLQIQDFDSTVVVTDNMKAAEFIVDLESGKTRLRTFFTGDEGLSLGAYYVYVSLEE
jgi:arylsulfatase A-like enzyme